MIRTLSVWVGTLVFLTVCFVPFSRAENEPDVVPGVITANNVDVTADDGSLLSDRLGVGDMVHIVTNPKNKKKGWVRITRSPNDTVGIGWVEGKNVQRFSEYRETSGAPEKPRPSSDQAEERTVYSPDAGEKVTYSKIAILPFVAGEPGDPFGRKVFDQFSSELRSSRRFQISTDIPARGVNVESAEDLRRILQTHRLDGLFVGKVSSPVGGSRLLQVKFLGKGRDSFTLEKTTRIPAQGDIRQPIQTLVKTCLEFLSSN